ncbi:MAG: hypothetical protein COA84_13980 [Robiginitomaculum sp.]|nr:MAG: hypothetical protein COA84_13980 [Robiginitomaculum sp.]
MKTRIIGDIHGSLHGYKNALDGCEKSIQIGDFGFGFNSPRTWYDEVLSIQKGTTHRFIRGNHDDPNLCKVNPAWIPDGTIENDVMFIGGAWTIDSWHRTEGINIWHDEELSYAELEVVIDTYAMMRPRVMITHDCPSSVAQKMFIDSGKSMFDGPLIPTRTGQALQAMFELHQPEKWIYGHWHETLQEKINGTTFTCLGICDYMDVQL